jgi:ESS family glutamate:Na+ symporter
MTSSAWVPIILALPVLLVGEWLVGRVGFLRKFSIPAPVIGGLLVALLVLVLNLSGAAQVQIASKVTAPWWTWLVSREPEWVTHPEKTLSLPLLVGFFTCIGLNATWDIVRRGSVPLILFLAVATLLGVVQNIVGVVMAYAIGVHPLMGLVCGSITMAGGHATALGFATQLEQGGLSGAAVMGAASATLGLVVGGLLSGPVGAWLIRRHDLKAPPVTAESEVLATAPGGILHDFRTLGAMGLTALLHLLVVVACMKAGTWLSFWLQKTGVTFPIHIGAMIVGLVLRNALDLSSRRVLRTEVIGTLGSAMLAGFLIFAMMGLNLIDLAGAALPMLCILAVELVASVLVAAWICWPVMGRDYEAAVMAAGLCGFGIGNTANAVASMKSIVEEHGPAPRAFLVVPLVGAMLGDLTNALNITLFLNLLK